MKSEEREGRGTESPIVDEVRARAAEISARYGHDLRKYAEHLAKVQRQHPGRVVDQPRVGKAEEHRSKPAA